MRETLDCGVLMVPAHAGWMDAWMQRHAGQATRVRLHAVTLDDGTLVVGADGIATACHGAQAAGHVLARLALSLRRFDACLLPITPDTLGWTRMALSCAGGGLLTPLIGLARGLKAAAVQDLLMLGMKDFVRDPLCPEELRVRVDRVAGDRAIPNAAPYVAPNAAPNAAPYSAPYAVQGATPTADAWPPTPTAPRAVREPMAPYYETGPVPPAIARAARAATMAMGLGDARPRLPREALDSGLLAIQAAPRVHPDEPFRIAKSRVVDSFERDYVRTALSRHAGNVARAARASAKHRRAFWALMRKHHIDAAPYRSRQAGNEQSD
ncbi:hypothetical protein CAL26_24995 [Bordetella genomosp. 9]|uniref:DNA binding HTH domain-containing protein n=1 Tax=Bordetella genomosp. 9 TaxID=1416803 RepID=A0A261R6V1_9BORD|nr:hypothetical protein [Bordetella genomosp. 9]OZI20739.1 hypothetical protein CAL26_24995 [Bordetella genomosp. 9]